MTSTPGGPGLWEQAPSSRGGRLAVALACLLALTAAVALATTARGPLASASAATGQGSLESIPGRMGGTLHGEVTRPTNSGGTEVLLVQTGSVTASSSAEVTVTSTDGFVESYAIGSTTQVRGTAKQAGLTVGARVTVVASKDGKRALLVASKGGSA